MDNPNYYAIIPADVRYAKIPDGAKLLYGEITALSDKRGYCFASNSYFADLYSVSNDTISRWIKSLSDMGSIISEIDRENGNTRKLYIGSTKNLSAKMPRGIRKNADTLSAKMPIPIGKNAEHNNTSNNTSIINTNNILSNDNIKEKNSSFDQNSQEEKIPTPTPPIEKAIQEFVKFRKEIKKPMTGHAIKLFVGELKKLSQDEQEQIKIIEQSILNGRQSIYPLKHNNAYNTNKTPRPSNSLQDSHSRDYASENRRAYEEYGLGRGLRQGEQGASG